jgi:hypothetical protein
MIPPHHKNNHHRNEAGPKSDVNRCSIMENKFQHISWALESSINHLQQQHQGTSPVIQSCLPVLLVNIVVVSVVHLIIIIKTHNSRSAINLSQYCHPQSNR